MKYFVSADIHGFYDEWINALNEKQFDINNPDHKIIVCGDLFDRGKQAKQLQSFILELLAKDKVILIKGNHEDLALELVENYADYMFDIKNTHHYYNGTFQTMCDLTGMGFYEATTCLLEFKRLSRNTEYFKRIIPFMKDYYETENYVFVHSWVPVKNDTCEFDDNWRNADEKGWRGARWAKPVLMYRLGLTVPNKTLVFGHWHCSDFWAHLDYKKYGSEKNACYEPFITENIIALDACTVVSKKVNVVVIED